jgi:hypothetical protein
MQNTCDVLHCYMWRFRLCHIFPRYVINGTIFGKTVTEYKMHILIFSATSFQNTLILRRNERDIIGVHRCLCKVPVVLASF